MKYCMHCGNPLVDDALFCNQCGGKQPVRMESGRAGRGPAPSGGPDPSRMRTGPAENRGPGPYRQGFGDSWQSAAAGPGSRPKRGPGRGPRAGVIIAVLILLLACAAAAAVFFLPGPRNLIRRTFSSPEQYYRYVEGQRIKEFSENAAAIYGRTVREQLNTSDRGISYTADLTVSDQTKSLVTQYLAGAGAAGADLSWLNSVSLTGQLNMKDNQTSASVSALLNGTEITGANVLIDTAVNMGYLQVPDLSPDYAVVNLLEAGGYSAAETAAVTGLLRNLSAACPDEETAERLLTKYLTLVTEKISLVEKGSKTLTAGSVSKEYTALDVTIDAGTAAGILNAVADEMQADTELRQICDNLQSAAGTQLSVPGGLYDSAVSQLRELALQITQNSGTTAAVMTVYVDGAGEIRGRTVSAEGVEYLRLARPKDGSGTGFDYTVNSGDQIMRVSGSGTEKGDLLTGDFQLTLTAGNLPAELLRFSVTDLDMKRAKEGYLNGKCTIAPGSGLTAAMSGYGTSTGVSAILAGLSLDVDMTSSKDASAALITVNYNGSSLGTLNVTANMGSAGEIPAVTNAKTVDEYTAGLNYAGLQNIVNRLAEAGVPAQYTDMLNQSLQYYIAP